MRVGNEGFRRTVLPDYTSPFGSMLTAYVDQINIFLVNEFRVRAPIPRTTANRAVGRFAVAAATFNSQQSAPGSDLTRVRSLALSEPDLLALGFLELPAPPVKRSLLERITAPPNPAPVATENRPPSNYGQRPQFTPPPPTTPTYRVVDLDSIYLNPQFSSPEAYYRSKLFRDAAETPEPATLGVTLLMLALAVYLGRKRLRSSRSRA